MSVRRIAVNLYRKLCSYRCVSRLIDVSATTIWRWCTKGIDTSGWLRRGPPPKMTDRLVTFLSETVARDPCLTQREMVNRVRDAFDVRVSTRLVGLTLRRIGVTRKRARCRLLPCRPRAHVSRKEFCDSLARADASGATIVSIDETGFHQRPKHAVYAYSKSGTRAVLHGRPCTSRRHTSMIAAIASKPIRGERAFHTLADGSVTSDTFAAFLVSLGLPAGTSVVLDNASIHKSHAVRNAARRCGIELLFVPPYSPELNPIEYAFSIVKRRFYRCRYDGEPGYGERRFDVHAAADASFRAVRDDHVDSVFGKVLRMARAYVPEST